MGRRLFWKLYITLLASVVIVAVLVGIVWRTTGESMFARWNAFRVQLADVLIPARDAPGSALREAVHRVGLAVGADVSLFAPDGVLLAAHGDPLFLPREGDEPGQRWRDHVMRVDLPDGRTVLARLHPPGPEPGLRILGLVLLVAGGVGAAAYPVTARLTRRLEALRAGVETWGRGMPSPRLAQGGRDEVALLARSFDQAAARIEALLSAQKALLANASHELRSPLARLRMAVEMDAPGRAETAKTEITRSLAEIDELVDEILLASRLDHGADDTVAMQRVDLLGLAAEEASRIGATVEGRPVDVEGDATLLRRLVRNLLDNAARHGAPPVLILVGTENGRARLTVRDHGLGIPAGERERVFEPFYRPQGRSEASGGWGLGLALVRQIARRHDGSVHVADVGEGTCFVVDLPLAARIVGGEPSPAAAWRPLTAASPD